MRATSWFAFAVLVLASGLAAVSLGGDAASGGVGNAKFAKAGCLCHGQGSTPATGESPPGQASAATQVTVAVADASGNATTEFTPGDTYTLTVQVVNTAVQSVPQATFVAGFALWASNGTLAETDGNAQTRDGGVWTTHTATGASQSQWILTWLAPEAANATLHFAGNKVNGNRLNDPLDQWNRGTLELTALPAPPPPAPANNTTDDGGGNGGGIPGFEAVGALAVLGFVALALARRRRA